MQANRRELLKLAASMLVASAMPRPMLAASEAARKVILVTCGGIRREESVADREARNLPHISTEIAPHSVFYQWMRNGGVTSHFNTISSILTGRWQHIDDWGKLRPEHPTLFEYLRKEKHWGQEQCWYISSNKAMTSQIGASSSAAYGPEFGANVLFPKQLLINAEVAVSPGVAFGEYGEGYVRIGLVENEHRIRQAARNVKKFLAMDPASLPKSLDEGK